MTSIASAFSSTTITTMIDAMRAWGCRRDAVPSGARLGRALLLYCARNILFTSANMHDEDDTLQDDIIVANTS